jgi:hypothetical protein
VAMDELKQVLVITVPMVSLTERPHRRALVGLEALDEAYTVLLGRGFHGAGVEHLVVEVDILEVFELLVFVFDPEVGGVFDLSRCHGGVGVL